MKTRAILRQALACACAAGLALGQAPQVDKPKAPIWWRPFKSPTISNVRMTNSQRLHSLMRAGRLYLTLQDAIQPLAVKFGRGTASLVSYNALGQ